MKRMNWKQKAKTIHETVVKKWAPYSDEDKRFVALAMSGEVGEALNLIKKEWRGDFKTEAQRKEFAKKLSDEFADIRIYFELLAFAYGVDLDSACEGKMPELLRRWPECIPVIETWEQCHYDPIKCVTGEDGND